MSTGTAGRGDPTGRGDAGSAGGEPPDDAAGTAQTPAGDDLPEPPGAKVPPAAGEDALTRNGQDEGLRAEITVPRIPAEHADEAQALAQQVALRTKQLIDLLHRSRELGLPDPDGVGFVGLDYDTLDGVGFGLLTWSGALLRAVGHRPGGLIVPP